MYQLTPVERLRAMRTLAHTIEDWDPDDRPVSCANCLHAVVSGDPERPTAHCEMGHGRPKPLVRLIATQRPIGFKQAAQCPDFDGMG